MQFLCTIKSYKEFKMKYQIAFKAQKAIELLTKLNDKGNLFGLLNENDLYYINDCSTVRDCKEATTSY